MHNSGFTRIACRCVLLLSFQLLAVELHAQVVLSGRVVDAQSREAVPGAAVIAVSDGSILASTISLATGAFQLRLEPGREVNLSVSRQGYRTVTRDSIVIPQTELEIGEILMEADPIVLEEVRATAPGSRLTPGREWIRQRQLSGKGTFFSGAMLAVLDPPSLTRYLGAEMDFWVRYNQRGEPSLINQRALCTMVLLNQWPLNRTFSVDGFVERTGWPSLDDIPIENIAAIEIYEDTKDVPGIHHVTWATRCTFINVWTWDSY